MRLFISNNPEIYALFYLRHSHSSSAQGASLTVAPCHCGTLPLPLSAPKWQGLALALAGSHGESGRVSWRDWQGAGRRVAECDS